MHATGITKEPLYHSSFLRIQIVTSIMFVQKLEYKILVIPEEEKILLPLYSTFMNQDSKTVEPR